MQNHQSCSKYCLRMLRRSLGNEVTVPTFDSRQRVGILLRQGVVVLTGLYEMTDWLECYLTIIFQQQLLHTVSVSAGYRRLLSGRSNSQSVKLVTHVHILQRVTSIHGLVSTYKAVPPHNAWVHLSCPTLALHIELSRQRCYIDCK